MLCYGLVLAETQDASQVEAMFLKFNCCLVLKTPETSKALSARKFCYIMLLETWMTDGCQKLGPCLKEDSFLTL